ncbi:MAG: transglutaminase domain-containing protein [Candidatus Brockarchaeota archaeon]|nr:transglutaminase domain-containing protein [Candidatus Brockarchaeota archaeon]
MQDDDLDAEFLVAGLPDAVRRLEEKGLFEEAVSAINRLLSDGRTLTTLLRSRLEWELERIMRVKWDYCLSKKDAFKSLSEQIPGLTMSEFDEWLGKGLIDHMEIEGEIRIFRNFLPNFLRERVEVRSRLKARNDTEIAGMLRKHLDTVVRRAVELGTRHVEPVKNRVSMVLRVKPEAVPDGETVRVWIPFPQRNELQPFVKLVSTLPEKYFLSPENTPQRTIYFEEKSVKDRELEFSVEYEYVVNAAYVEIDPERVSPYTEGESYRRFTSEFLPHVAFTPYLRRLADELVAGESNPYLKAWRIYDWITGNVSYALVPEYSTIECISDYAARNLKGDCGVQALLFITLCRISGVPARWQSGWYLNPIRPSPHDWAQFYVEPYGWLYADPSFGGHWRKVEKYHRFYFGNIDHYRLVANTDLSANLTPPKKYFRSDTVDNQRGEVEWKGGNLYYDKWTYELKVLSHEKISETA